MEIAILWLLCGIASAAIANSKGRSGCGWFLLGILFGPFGFVVAALPSMKTAPRAPTPKTHVQCPDCAELILKEARKCKHCGCKVIPDDEVGLISRISCKARTCTGEIKDGYCLTCGKSDKWVDV